MNKKIQLPDELLDIVSGGAISWQGKPASYVSISAEQLVLEGADGPLVVTWDPGTTALFKDNPGVLSKIDTIFKDAQADGKTHRLEEAFAELGVRY